MSRYVSLTVIQFERVCNQSPFVCTITPDGHVARLPRPHGCPVAAWEFGDRSDGTLALAWAVIALAMGVKLARLHHEWYADAILAHAWQPKWRITLRDVRRSILDHAADLAVGEVLREVCDA